MPMTITPPMPGSDPTAMPEGDATTGGGPSQVPTPLQPGDPMQGSAPAMPAPPPLPGMPDASQPMPTDPSGQAGMPPGQPAAPGAAPGGTGAPSAPQGVQGAPGAPQAPPPAPPGAPGNIACQVADPNSQQGAQCAAAMSPAPPVIPGGVGGMTTKMGQEAAQRAAREKAAAAVDTFVDIARRRPLGRLDAAQTKRAGAYQFAGTPMGAGLQGLQQMGPPPVPPVMQPRRPGAAPPTNFAAGGAGTALSHRPIGNPMSAMQGKPMLPGVRGPNGLLGKPGMSIAPKGTQGIGMASPAHKIAMAKQAVLIEYKDPKTGEPKAEDHETLAAKVAKQLRQSAEGSYTASLLHNAMVDRMEKIPLEKRAMDDWYACGGGPGEPDAECMARAKKGREERARARAKAAPIEEKVAWLIRALDPIVKRAAGEEMMDPTAGAPAEGDPTAGGAPPSGGGDKGEDAGKASQKEAQYGPAVSAARSCAMCQNFDGQSKCAVVAGPVQPTGTSAMFTPKAEMAGISPAAISAAPLTAPEGTKLGRYMGPMALPLAVASLGGLAIGGVGGGVRAPKGHKAEGAARGALTGRMSGALGLGGALGGGLLAQHLAEAQGASDDTQSASAIAAALGGGVLGGVGGAKLNNWLMGPPSWEKDRKEKSAGAIAYEELMDKLAGRTRTKTKKLKPFMPSKGRFRRKKAEAEKEALKRQPVGNLAPSKMLASTLGRLNALPAGLMLTPDNPLKHVMGPGKDTKNVEDRFERARPDDLKDVKVHHGGTPIWQGLKNVWNNPRTSPIGKTLGTLTHPMSALMTGLERADHFDPFTNAVTVHSGHGEVAAHELGHALNFNKIRAPEGAPWHRRIGPQLAYDAYSLGGMIPYLGTGLRLGQEAEASRQALKVMGETAKPSERAGEQARLKQRLSPALGTYVGSAALGGLGGSALGALGGHALAMGANAAKGQGAFGGFRSGPISAGDAKPRLKLVGKGDGRKGRDADGDGEKEEGRRKAASMEKCACNGSTRCGPCKAKKKYREVGPERREGGAKFAWRGKGAKNVTDDPGYEKYIRKSAADAALDAILKAR